MLNNFTFLKGPLPVYEQPQANKSLNVKRSQTLILQADFIWVKTVCVEAEIGWVKMVWRQMLVDVFRFWLVCTIIVLVPMLQSLLNMVLTLLLEKPTETACVVSPLGVSTLLKLGWVLWTAGVPFLVCRTYGLIGYMRLVVKEHTGEVIPGHNC